MYLAISTAFDMMAPEPAQIPHFLLIKKKKFLRFFPFLCKTTICTCAKCASIYGILTYLAPVTMYKSCQYNTRHPPPTPKFILSLNMKICIKKYATYKVKSDYLSLRKCTKSTCTILKFSNFFRKINVVQLYVYMN